jgi:hypothetical protein
MLETRHAARLLAHLAAVAALASRAAAQPPEPGKPTGQSDPTLPPPISTHYAQYGVALAAHSVLDAGDVCPASASAPCILGSGGGLGIRIGYRGRGDWYLGGAYEFSRQAAANLLRLPVLQQLRAEARYETTRATRVIPYFVMGLGAVAYGNEWGVDTAGVVAMGGAGVALQLSRASLVGAALSYRPLLLKGWTDGAGERRADSFGGFGAAHLISLELTFEIRSPLSRW